MKRHAVACLVLWSGLLYSAVVSSGVVAPPTGRIHHVVIVWLKDHGSQTARERYIKASRALAKLPMVLRYKVGIALPDGRDAVDSTYDVAITATFESRQALDEYLRHPEHDKVIAESLKPLVDKVIVYDFSEVP